MNAERVLTLPLEAAIMVGQGILWITERAVPPTPTYELKPASLTIFEQVERTSGQIDGLRDFVEDRLAQ